jgi:hypothetical protein
MAAGVFGLAAVVFDFELAGGVDPPVGGCFAVDCLAAALADGR